MRSLFFKFSGILIFSLLAIFSSAQNVSEDVPITTLGTITNEGEGIFLPLEFCLNDNNDLIVKVNVLLGNLEIQGENPNYYGVIPSHYPDMFVEFTIDDVVYTPVPVGNFDIVTLENGYVAYSFIASSPAIDYSNECHNLTEEKPYIDAIIMYRLVTQEGEGWITYPACDYDQSWSMFNCYVYSHAPWCEETPGNGFAGPTDPTPNCYDEWFAGGFSAKMYCDCDDDIPTFPDDKVAANKDDFFKGDVDIDKRFSEDVKIDVYPNPMNNLLHIESNDNNIQGVELYNSRGDLMVRKEYALNNTSSIRLNTEDFPSGLYFARIATLDGIKVIKVLK